MTSILPPHSFFTMAPRIIYILDITEEEEERGEYSHHHRLIAFVIIIIIAIIIIFVCFVCLCFGCFFGVTSICLLVNDNKFRHIILTCEIWICVRHIPCMHRYTLRERITNYRIKTEKNRGKNFFIRSNQNEKRVRVNCRELERKKEKDGDNDDSLILY